MRVALLVLPSLLSWVAAQDLVVPWADRVPRLNNLSTWRQDLDAGTARDGDRGAFPLGSGALFGCFGLASDGAATVQGLCGPDYAAAGAPDGDFGAQSFQVFAGGARLALPRQTVAKVRGANLVVTADQDAAGIRLTTLNFTPPGSTHLYRIVQLHNGSRQDLDGVELRAVLSHATAEPNATDTLHVRRESGARRRALAATFLPGKSGEPPVGFVVDGALVQPLGKLPAGATVESVLALHAWVPGDTQIFPLVDRQVVPRLLEDTLQAWQDRLAGTTTAVSDPPRFADLFEDGKILLLAQRSAANGLFAPMVAGRTCTVRNLSGPLLACLRYRLWQDARTLLQTIAHCAARDGALPETLPLDVVPPPPGDVAWDRIAVPPGGLGSLFVLWHEWYWRATGDLSLVRAHRALLERCVHGQGFSAEGLQPFPTDEPLAALTDRLEPGGATLAHAPWAGRSSYSLEANALYVLAWMALGELQTALAGSASAADGPAAASTVAKIEAEALRKAAAVSKLTEDLFWDAPADRFAPALSPIDRAPFTAPLAPINLALQWYGWTFTTAGHNHRNLRGTLRDLWRAPDAVRVGATAGNGFATGDTQPLLVHALADLDDRRRDGAVAELLAQMAPAGALADRCNPNGRPAAGPDGAIRHADPGPTGLAIDALGFALTGMRYAAIPAWDNGRQARFQPRLPPATTRLELRDVWRDGRHLHLTMAAVLAELAPEELALQDELVASGRLEAAAKKEPGKPYPRLRCQVVMENPPPDDQHITCAVDVGPNTLIRHLAERLPSFQDSVDPPVDLQDHWPADGPATPSAPRPAPADGATLLLACRSDAGRRHAGLAATVVDAGAAVTPEALAARLQASAATALVIDVGVLGGGPGTGKAAAFWQHPALVAAIARFGEAPRTLRMPEFVTTWTAVAANGQPGTVAVVGPDGRLGIRGGTPGLQQTWTATCQLDVANPVAGVLRVGAADPFTVRLGDTPVLAQRGFGITAADQAEAPIQLAAGRHTLTFAVEGRGEPTFHLRLCGADGQPLPGVTARLP